MMRFIRKLNLALLLGHPILSFTVLMMIYIDWLWDPQSFLPSG